MSALLKLFILLLFFQGILIIIIGIDVLKLQVQVAELKETVSAIKK